MIQFNKILTEAEIWYGFLRIPKRYSKLLLSPKGKANIYYGTKKYTLNYNKKYNRVYGLRRVYNEQNPKTGDAIAIKIVD